MNGVRVLLAQRCADSVAALFGTRISPRVNFSIEEVGGREHRIRSSKIFGVEQLLGGKMIAGNGSGHVIQRDMEDSGSMDLKTTPTDRLGESRTARLKTGNMYCIGAIIRNASTHRICFWEATWTILRTVFQKEETPKGNATSGQNYPKNKCLKLERDGFQEKLVCAISWPKNLEFAWKLFTA